MDAITDQSLPELSSGPHKKPDVMNDPAYETNNKGKQNNAEEPDTCRICRGEGSQEEPLFYPCKCSGSIKFVHQNCLMEWLSHSQKKHCELCKTPFHFTKLYHPQMPNTVPLTVFLRQAAVHVWKSMVTSSRFLLVMFVWAAWLPWCMRTIWRGLFWIGDGAWANGTEGGLFNETAAHEFFQSVAAKGISPVPQGLLTSKEATTSTIVGQISSKFPRFIPPADKLLTFTGQPWSLLLIKKAYSYLTGEASARAPSYASEAANTTSHAGSLSRSSWLSEFQFLKTLTPSTMVNNMLIDTLEGQLITLVVVTAFILTFLIREWVVQQQPIINGGVNLNAELGVARARDAALPAQQQAADQRQNLPEGGAVANPPNEGVQAQRHRARMIARARPRQPRRQSEQAAVPTEGPSTGAAPDRLAKHKSADDIHSSDALEESSGSASPSKSLQQSLRPTMPDRDILARAAEVRRTIEEHSQASASRESAMETFTDLWVRAGKEPTNVINIIEHEGLNAELGWIVAAMKKIEGAKAGDKTDQEESHTQSQQSKSNAAGSQPDSDEDFVLLNRLSINSSPEPSHKENEISPNRNRPAANSPTIMTSTSHLGSPEPSQERNIEDPSPNLQNQAATSTDVDQDSNTRLSDIESIERSSADMSPVSLGASDRSTNHSANNPFSPDYEGDLPQANTYPEVGPSNEELIHPDETSPPEPGSSRPEGSQSEAPQTQAVPEHTRSLFELATEWLWGGVAPPPVPQEQPAGDDEHIVNDIADEAPFVAIDHGQPLPLAANDGAVANQDPDVVAAAIQAGLNPNEAEAAEEIEDLEGILELIGMQGPLAGLVQNGMFCACLVSVTILLGVWVPYIAGKLFLVLLAHPISLLFRIPIRWASSSADTVIDVFTFCAGCAFYWTDSIISVLCAPVALLLPSLGRLRQNTFLAEIARSYAERALERLAKTFMATGDILTETDIPMFSVIAHESLQSIKAWFAWVIQGSCCQVAAILELAYTSSGSADFLKVLLSKLSDQTKAVASSSSEKALSILSRLPSLLQIDLLRINIAMPQRTLPLDYGLAYWNVKDRALAVGFGYVFFALIGAAYLHLSSRLNGTKKNGRANGGLADGLYQAGGVVKVILIISIEMIAFPLYCGLLLDIALLPLFGDTTLLSRINFTFTSPNTSLFVHWFVGTCYMFHFALFVSMCRKILRSGVLYFIRDPDDPTFHPVRDVLERSVSTQLWKISFSALVYGGLVMVCLGGVVWGISYAFEGVFPIHWSSNEPILEFPVDLLFYNFLMPLAVKFFKPSKGLNKMFGWWFRKCARSLQLTNFLFGDEKKGGDHGQGQSWANLISGNDDGAQSSGPKQRQISSAQKDPLEATAHPKGKYVRAPGSDQVRIPRGANTFLEVDEHNNRLDGQPDSDDGLHGRKNEMFTKVYIPPMFRVRISAFIFLIWAFTAITGISITILPLVFGRFFFAKVAPSHFRMNDIYAFSTGVYILGGTLYSILQRQRLANYVRETLTPHTTTITSFLRKSAVVSTRLLGLFYVYTSFGILLPALLSVLMEFFFIIPIHTYFSTTFESLEIIQSERHIIHLVQDWTLGVLYLKMAARLILWYTPARPAVALRAIVRDGWFDPDVRLATRGFIIPTTLAIGIALATPLCLGWLANVTVLHSLSNKDDLFRACVYRYSYPGVLGLGFVIASVWLLAKAFSGWRKKVRDEVYLIGERLHNFGEIKRRKGSGKGKGRAAVIADPVV